MLPRICPCCKKRFTPNKYHPEQEFCSEPQCQRASHVEANRKWRAAQRREDPLRESQRKARARRGEKHRLSRQLSVWRKQLAHQQMLLLGIVGLLAGTPSAELNKTISRCLDAGRELLREAAWAFGDTAQNP